MILCPSVFNVWPKTTLLLPGWRGDAQRLDPPERLEKAKTQSLQEEHSCADTRLQASETVSHSDLQNVGEQTCIVLNQ